MVMTWQHGNFKELDRVLLAGHFSAPEQASCEKVVAALQLCLRLMPSW